MIFYDVKCCFNFFFNEMCMILEEFWIILIFFILGFVVEVGVGVIGDVVG